MPSLAELLANLSHCRVYLGNVISLSSHVCPPLLLSSTNCINSILDACCECFGDVSGMSLSDDCVLASAHNVVTYWCSGDDCVLQLTVELCVREVSLRAPSLEKLQPMSRRQLQYFSADDLLHSYVTMSVSWNTLQSSAISPTQEQL